MQVFKLVKPSTVCHCVHLLGTSTPAKQNFLGTNTTHSGVTDLTTKPLVFQKLRLEQRKIVFYAFG
jgi:hypothetical protein